MATEYPLAVKLGTITPDGRGDVYSYDEDDMVEDPKLAQHLAHFGINVAVLEKVRIIKRLSIISSNVLLFSFNTRSLEYFPFRISRCRIKMMTASRA